MSLLSRLFGGGGADAPSAAEPVEYEGFRIIPDPIGEDGQYRIAARIEADADGQTRSHHMIRADVLRDRDDAEAASVKKAKQLIDQQGMRLFG